MRWDVGQIFEEFGGAKGIFAFLAQTSRPPARVTVAVWRTRGRISSIYLPVLVQELAARGALSRVIVPTMEDVGL